MHNEQDTMILCHDLLLIRQMFQSTRFRFNYPVLGLLRACYKLVELLENNQLRMSYST